MQTALFGIWTRVANFISYNGNHYAKDENHNDDNYLFC